MAIVKLSYHKTLGTFYNSGNLCIHTCYSSFLDEDTSSWNVTEESGSKNIVMLYGHSLKGILDLSIGETAEYTNIYNYCKMLLK